MWRALVVLAILLAHAPAYAAKKPTRAQLHEKALKAYQDLEFKTAAELFGKEIDELKPSDLGKPVEQEAREKYVLSLYESGKKDQATAEYRTLKDHFPAFKFDDNTVLPETIEYFERVAPTPVPVPTPTPTSTPKPKEIIASPESQPREVKASTPQVATAPVVLKKPWSPKYLLPLGIGQFLAGSPVRGVIFAILQAGFIAADVALFVRYNQIVSPVSFTRANTPDIAQGYAIQYAMDTMFFSMIGAVAAGLIDGIFFEP